MCLSVVFLKCCLSLNFSPAHHQSVEDDSRERRSQAPSRGPSKRPPGAPSNSPERRQTIESLGQSGRQDLRQGLRQSGHRSGRQSGHQSDLPPSNTPSRPPSKRPSGSTPLKNYKCWADPVPGSKKSDGLPGGLELGHSRMPSGGPLGKCQPKVLTKKNKTPQHQGFPRDSST